MNNYLKTENFEKKGKKHQNNKIYKKTKKHPGSATLQTDYSVHSSEFSSELTQTLTVS